MEKKINVRGAVVFAALFAVIYYVTAMCLTDRYIPLWSAQSVFWFAAPVTVLLALLNKFRFCLLSTIGYGLAVAIGETFDKMLLTDEYVHFGWIFFLIVYAIACGVGVWLQIMHERSLKKSEPVNDIPENK